MRVDDEVLNLIRRHRAVQGVGGGDCADQDQHNEPHTLLSVIRSVRKTDTGAGENQ